MRATSQRSHKSQTALTKTLMGAALLTAAFLAPPTALAHDDDEDHGPQAGDVQEVHALTGFDKIDIRGVYRLKVTVGEGFRVFTSGAPKEVKGMKVYRDGRALVLDQKRDGKKVKGDKHGVWAEISLPALNSLVVSGVGTGDVIGVDAKVFEMDVQGVGELEVSGRCDKLDAVMKGVGNIEAKELKCEQADVWLKGVGAISVYAFSSALQRLKENIMRSARPIK